MYIDFKEPVIDNSKELNINFDLSNKKKSREIVLYNDKKEIIKSLLSHDLKVEIDVSDLNRGFYYLHVNTLYSNEKSIVIVE